MTRLTSFAAAIVLAAAGSAYAQSQAQIAAQLNDEGKELMFANKFAEASAKFREAVARVPEAKYFFNLCTSLYQEGKFDEAMTACNAVEKNNPSGELHGKNEKLIGRIRDEAKAQNIELHPTGGGGGDPNTPPPDPNTPPPDPNTPPNTNPTQPTAAPAIGKPPTQGLFVATRPDHHYTWSLGLDFYGGGGRYGQPDIYGTAAGGVRFKGDVILMPRNRVGMEGYLQITHVGAGSMQSPAAVTALDIVDIGVAGYKHICLRGAERLCLTPLLGIQLALLSPGEMDSSGNTLFNYAAVGARGELNLSLALGRRYEHVLSAMVGVNAYSPALSSSSDSGFSAAELGIDAGGAFGYIGFGYTYRFNTPIGTTAFITLE
jgi:hypothetical protein